MSAERKFNDMFLKWLFSILERCMQVWRKQETNLSQDLNLKLRQWQLNTKNWVFRIFWANFPVAPNNKRELFPQGTVIPHKTPSEKCSSKFQKRHSPRTRPDGFTVLLCSHICMYALCIVFLLCKRKALGGSTCLCGAMDSASDF